MLKVKDIVKELKNLREKQSTSGNKSTWYSNLYSNILSEKNCQNSFRTTSGLENIVGRIKKFEEKLPIATEKKERNLTAIDETVVKAGKKRYYVYSAVDVERNELILMRVYTTRNSDFKVFY